MPRTIACPNCQTRLEVADADLGKTLTCPNCRAAVPTPPQMSLDAAPISTEPRRPPASTQIAPTAHAGRPAYRDDEYEEQELDISHRDEGRGWGATITGLRLIFWSSVIYLVIGVLLPIFTMITLAQGKVVPGMPGAPPPQPGDFGPLQGFAMAAGCTVIIIAILTFVGMCMCCTGPDPTARRRALVSILCLAGSIVVLVALMAMAISAVFAMIGQGAANPPDNEKILRSLGAAGIAAIVVFIGLVVASWVLWLLFHSAIARHFGAATLAARTRTLLIVSLVFMVIGQAVNMWPFFATPPKFHFALLQVLGLVNTIVVVGGYAHVCQSTYRTIEEHTLDPRRRSPDERFPYGD
jgi:hypothetical protein